MTTYSLLPADQHIYFTLRRKALCTMGADYLREWHFLYIKCYFRAVANIQLLVSVSWSRKEHSYFWMQGVSSHSENNVKPIHLMRPWFKQFANEVLFLLYSSANYMFIWKVYKDTIECAEIDYKDKIYSSTFCLQWWFSKFLL